MKTTNFLLLIASVSVTFAATAHAQIVFGAATAITGSDNIITDGTYFDALQTGTGKSAYSIGTNIFNDAVATTPNYPAPYANLTFISNLGDGIIDVTPDVAPNDNNVFGAGLLSISGDAFNGAFTTGNTTDNTTFSSILNRTVYNSDSFSNITLSGLTLGNVYEVQVFKAADDVSRNTVINGGVIGDSQQLAGATYTIGLLTATSTSSTFTFAPGTGGSYGEATDIVVRNLGAVPEPSTYAMIFGALGMLVLVSRFRGKLVE